MKIYSHLSTAVIEGLFNKIYIFLLLGVIFSNESEISPKSQYSLNAPIINYSSDVVLNLGISNLDYSEGGTNNNSSQSNYGHSFGLAWFISPNLSLDGGFIDYKIDNNNNILKLYYNLRLHFNVKGKYISTISIAPISKNKIIFGQDSNSQYSFGGDMSFKKIFNNFIVNIGNYYIYGDQSYSKFDIMVIYELREYINLMLGMVFTEHKHNNIMLNIGFSI